MDKRQIAGMDLITEMLVEKGFTVDHFEYKVIKKSEIHRPINPKLKNSPKQKVIVEEKVNINANIKTVGQLEWRIYKDPENILLIQIVRTKGETLSLPLVFPNILNKGHQILVTGLTSNVRLQLISKPDLKFMKIPDPIEQCPEFKEQLIQRASRLKGMQATARELIDFPGLPDEIVKKIGLISSGKKEALSDAEAINLIILSDLHSRYSAMFHMFQMDIIERKTSVANLARQFEILTQKVSTRFLVSKFLDFLGENAAKCKTNYQVFTFLYQKLQQMDEKKIYVNKKLLDRKDLFHMLRSIVCVARSQFDPDLWKQCLFFLDPNDENTIIEENKKAIDELAAKSQNSLLSSQASTSGSLLEIYIINNIKDFIIDKKVSLAEDSLPKQEAEILKSTIASQLRLKAVKDTKKNSQYRLFTEPNRSIQKLINPLHCVSGAYGSLVGKLLMEKLKRYLKQGLKPLIERFGNHFFNIFFEQAVFESGINISRNQFAQWMELIQLVTKAEDFGYIPNEIETDFDPSLTSQVLSGSGQSVLPLTYTNEDFEKGYLKSRSIYLAFFERLRQSQSTQNDAYNPASIFLDFVSTKRKYNFRSAAFRTHVKTTFLFEELHIVVKDACGSIKAKLAEESINKKAILKLPLKYNALLFLGNTFQIPTGKMIVSVRLHTIPVKAMDETFGISYEFEKNFSKLLQETEKPERAGIIQSMRILGEYKKVSADFFKFLSLVLLDRQIHQNLLKLKRRNLEPRFIKFKTPDHEKMMIGSMQKVNLNKLLQYNFPPRLNEKEVVNNQSFGEMIQSIMYYKSVVQNIENRIDVVKKIGLLLDRFSDSLKEGKEWNSYSTLLEKFREILTLPIEDFDEPILKKLAAISVKMNRLVTKH
ncbi:hypothetical protein KKA14_18180, partial [bacterium]|nr:hypothetical protein [bacterium]